MELRYSQILWKFDALVLGGRDLYAAVRLGQSMHATTGGVMHCEGHIFCSSEIDHNFQ